MYLQREQYCAEHSDFREGITVYSSDGEKLGEVAELYDDHFVIAKGFFFPEHFTARYDDLVRVDDEGARLRLTKDQLNPWRDENYAGWQPYESDGVGAARGMAPIGNLAPDGVPPKDVDEVRVPVVEEELEARKTRRRAGEVRLRKIVHTEMKHLSVPVTREEVIVERVPAAETTPSVAEFREDTVAVPVMEEEVELVKRPVLREEVRLRKEKVTEERRLEGEVRREEVEIDRDDAPPRSPRKAG